MLCFEWIAAGREVSWLKCLRDAKGSCLKLRITQLLQKHYTYGCLTISATAAFFIMYCLKCCFKCHTLLELPWSYEPHSSLDQCNLSCFSHVIAQWNTGNSRCCAPTWCAPQKKLSCYQTYLSQDLWKQNKKNDKWRVSYKSILYRRLNTWKKPTEILTLINLFPLSSLYWFEESKEH